jgi:arginine utilization protein RocB
MPDASQAGAEPALAQRIQQLAQAFVGVPSHTGTRLETQVDAFYRDWFGRTPYFRRHPDHAGLHPLPDDPLGRSVAWALVRGGDAARTVILIHHYDTADIRDYGTLQPLAYDPAALTGRMAELARAGRLAIPPEALEDLDGGDWLFGRGVCDMKGGAAIEMALLEAYGEQAGFRGNLLMLGLPDEENLSAGMRGAVPLLHLLKARFGLDYRLLVNTEPHMRVQPDTGVLYEGSVGKIMPVVYVKGAAAHVGQVFNGFNPVLLMAEIVRRTELNPDFLEVVGTEATLPPTWLYCKDQKDYYDVSLPLAAAGYLNLLTLVQSPGEHLERLRGVCREAFAAVIAQMEASHREYRRRAGLAPASLPWQPDVRTFDELERQAERQGGAAYAAAKAARGAELKAAIAAGRTGLAEASVALIELALDHSGLQTPVAVLALAPPYYPSVSNRQMRDRLQGDPGARPDQPFLALGGLAEDLRRYARAAWDQPYGVVEYFNGLSDLSYAIYHFDPSVMAATRALMPLWGENYSIPFAEIRELSVPVMNIGPWGKDFHKNTERVYLPDLCRRTPALVQEAIRLAL